jgi:hypothetical protein
MDQCAAQASRTSCESDTEVPAVCVQRQIGVRNLHIYQGAWAAVVVVIFSIYTYLFNGIVFAILTQSWHLTTWQRTVMSSGILKVMLKPFIGNILEKEILEVSCELRQWREALRSLANWLALVSIGSFVLKAAMEIDRLSSERLDNAGAFRYGVSIISVEAVPSILSMLFLLRYHCFSSGQDNKRFLLETFLSGNYRENLLN